MVADTKTKSRHREKPPCFCDQCLRATAKADPRAELAAILERLAELDRLAVQS